MTNPDPPNLVAWFTSGKSTKSWWHTPPYPVPIWSPKNLLAKSPGNLVDFKIGNNGCNNVPKREAHGFDPGTSPTTMP
jgi:hypothetical protein